MLILGHGLPSGMACGSCGLSSVHGQPLRPDGVEEAHLRLGSAQASNHRRGAKYAKMEKYFIKCHAGRTKPSIVCMLIFFLNIPQKTSP